MTEADCKSILYPCLLATFMIYSVRWLSLLGFVLCAYSLHVMNNLRKYKSYKPLCDVKENISCSKAFTSKYGYLTGFPNPIYGLVFYTIIFISTLYYNTRLILYLSMLSVAFSLYLAYISYFKQKNFCLVCSTIYLINLLILLMSM